MIPRLSVIAAVDNKGNVWYSLTQANTDSEVLLLFLRHLSEKLDLQRANWREDTVVLLDGAKYHTSVQMREYLRVLGIRTCYSGPYSFDGAVCELLFSGLKLGELNTNNERTGKR